jgi:hypothetical protein
MRWYDRDLPCNRLICINALPMDQMHTATICIDMSGTGFSMPVLKMPVLKGFA